jgi:ribonuclease-3
MPPQAPAQELCDRLSYQFSKPELLRQALTHKSCVHDGDARSPKQNNERFEFLGDAILDLLISELLMDRFSGLSEGGLSKLRASLVNESGLYRIANSLELGRFLFMGKGEEMTGGRAKASLLADAVEALFAAIYLDSREKQGLQEVTRIVHKLFSSVLPDRMEDVVVRDFKSELQEYVQKHFGVLVTYELMHQIGPDHQKEFKMAALVEQTAYGLGTGKSKKQAGQRAAEQALETLVAQAAFSS